MDAIRKYFHGLSEAEQAEHERIEAELYKAAREGFAEATALSFVMTVVQIRKVLPEAYVPAILDTALRVGVVQVLEGLLAAQQPVPIRAPKRKPRAAARLVR